VEGFKRELAQRRQQIDQVLESYLPAESVYSPRLREGMRYALGGGGKRIRPVLLLEAYRLASGREDAAAMPAACALEMIHAYSLVHDDLPALDNDFTRRGRPTCHVAFGEAEAILIGDALLTQAFVVLSAGLSAAFSPEVSLRALGEIAAAAGADGMVGGQMLDLETGTRVMSLPELQQMHRGKTGKLLTAALRTGAILGAMPEEELRLLTDFSEYLGLLFQLTDDILDVVGEKAVLGKDTGQDARNHKTTFVSLWGLDVAWGQAETYAQQALKTLKNLSPDTDFLAAMTKYILSRSN
jgi:geranylgeranyl diphosphate synthase type II